MGLYYNGYVYFILRGEEIMGQLKTTIITALQYIGTPSYLLGFEYYVLALEKVYYDPSYVHRMMELYEEIGAEIGKSWTSVEKAMRTAVIDTWDYGNVFAIHEIFGYSLSADRDRPTNRAFITAMTRYIKIKSLIND